MASESVLDGIISIGRSGSGRAIQVSKGHRSSPREEARCGGGEGACGDTSRQGAQRIHGGKDKCGPQSSRTLNKRSSCLFTRPWMGKLQPMAKSSSPPAFLVCELRMVFTFLSGFILNGYISPYIMPLIWFTKPKTFTT